MEKIIFIEIKDVPDFGTQYPVPSFQTQFPVPSSQYPVPSSQRIISTVSILFYWFILKLDTFPKIYVDLEKVLCANCFLIEDSSL